VDLLGDDGCVEAGRVLESKNWCVRLAALVGPSSVRPASLVQS